MCIRAERHIEDISDAILLATIEYNRSFHSVTGRKPAELLRASQDHFPEVNRKLEKSQNEQLERNNQKRQNRVFDVGEKILVKANRRLGNKLSPLFLEESVEADMGTTVLISGRWSTKTT